MIEKCAALALEFHGEMDAEDEMDDDDHGDALDNASWSIPHRCCLDRDWILILTKTCPQTPQPQPARTQGSKGVIVAVVKRVVLAPLPWCNGPGMTAEPTKMRLPGIKNLYFYCFITSLQWSCSFSAIHQSLAITM
jgi:hypothetical protein